jgi:hypothetical protein
MLQPLPPAESPLAASSSDDALPGTEVPPSPEDSSSIPTPRPPPNTSAYGGAQRRGGSLGSQVIVPSELEEQVPSLLSMQVKPAAQSASVAQAVKTI